MNAQSNLSNLHQSMVAKNIEKGNVYIWFTFPIALLLAIASYAGIFVEGLYRDTPYYIAQAKGQDLVSLIIVLPAIITTSLLTKKGSIHGRMIWIGAMVYLVYTYAIASFSVKFNPLSPIYIGLLGLSLYGMIAGWVEVHKAEIYESRPNKIPRKLISIYLLLLASLFYIIWLRESIPAAMTGTIPQSVSENGTSTNAVHVLDMAWILPAFGITGVSVWRRSLLGYLLAGIMLSYINFLLLALLSMMFFLKRGGFQLFIPQAALFIVLLIINLCIFVLYSTKAQKSLIYQQKNQ